ncbi:MAG: transcriptional regulator [Thaumarchaeota archaeon]|nr:transcriptional regulator [Nitrososphaerota archaeon]
MNRDQLLGGLLLAVSIIVIIVYGWILFFTQWSILLMQITAFIAVAGILGILAWIGYTLATTPPPKPIEEVEKEIEEELKKVEESEGSEDQTA